MNLTAPLAPKRPHPITQHGQTRVDDYFWLRNRDDPEVRRYLEAENAYAEAVMAHTRDLQEALYREMRGRIQEDDTTVPVRRGEFFYYSRTEQDKQYPIYCRKRGALDAPEEILLDVNELAKGRGFCRLGNFEISPDHRYLAYSVDYSGAERFTLYIKDLHTGELLPEVIPDSYYTLEWANDSRTLFYTTLNAANRPHRVWRHVIGSDAAQDVLIYEEADESYFIWMRKSRSGRFLFLDLHNNNTSEWRYASADDPSATFTVFAPRRPGVEYRIDHHGDRFLILTNEDALNFKLMETPIDSPGRDHWRELVPHRPEVLLEGFDVFREHLVLYEREGGLKTMRVGDPYARSFRRVHFPEPVYTYWTRAWMEPDENPDFEARTLRFTYSSLVTPDTVVDYGLDDGSWTERKRLSIPGGYDPTQYVSERLAATAPDGTYVPISLVYRKGFRRDGRGPLLLHSYGAYGAPTEPFFNVNRLSLLDRGVAFALAHVRGGSEFGRAWYENGKLLHKRNTFTDFIACAEHLIAQGYTASDRLAILGVSAGGLLVTAAMTMRPDLFHCVVAKVPFVDVVNTMSDPTIPLTVIEWEEWGNPADKTLFDYMLSYSPYDNIQPRAYPHLLVTAGLNDPRVAYWEPAKFVAKLRALKTDSNRLLLKTNMDAGHAGASGRFDYLREIAFEFAFVLDTLGLGDR
ncbi:MAG: S9 family peptidase [Anaerolineales bacterium]|nr:S9 family peptidase [Anaerolineales bacterium]